MKVHINLSFHLRDKTHAHVISHDMWFGTIKTLNEHHKAMSKNNILLHLFRSFAIKSKFTRPRSPVLSTSCIS
jgi:hypothetical protein